MSDSKPFVYDFSQDEDVRDMRQAQFLYSIPWASRQHTPIFYGDVIGSDDDGRRHRRGRCPRTDGEPCRYALKMMGRVASTRTQAEVE